MFDKSKVNGFLISCDRNGSSSFHCLVLLSSSVLIYVSLFHNSHFVSVGMQVFGSVYKFRGIYVFKLESVECFVGMAIWASQDGLLKLMALMDEVKRLPQNLVIDGVYERFLKVLMCFFKGEYQSLHEFHEWVNLELKTD